MADEKRTILIEIDVDNKDADKQIESTGKAIKKTGDQTEKATEQTQEFSSAFGVLDQQLGGIPSKAAGALKGVRGLTGGFKSLKVAIAATGIGLLIIALTSLVTFFSRSREGAEKLNKILAFLGAGVDVLLDLFADLGGNIFAAFENPKEALNSFVDLVKNIVLKQIQTLIGGVKLLGSAFTKLFDGDFAGAADDLGQGFLDVTGTITGANLAIDLLTSSATGLKNVFQDINEETSKALALQERQNLLSRQQLAFITTQAQLEADIADARLASEQVTKGVTFQLENNVKATRLLNSLTVQRKALLDEEIAIEEGKQALGLSTIEDEETLQNLRAERINLDKELSDRLTELTTKNISLTTELQRQLEIKKQIAEIEKRRSEEGIIELQSRAETEIQIAQETANRRTEINAIATEADVALFQNAELEKLKFSDQTDKEKAEAILGLASLAASVAVTLFGDSKAAAIAQAIINTALAVTQSLPNPFLAAAAGVLGGVQIAKIIATPPPTQTPLPSFADGGMMHGKLHSQGGIKAELEQGEAVINRRSMANPMLRELASQINQAGGGVKFAHGGINGNSTAAQFEIDNITSGRRTDFIPVLVTEDFNSVQNRVDVTEDLSTL